MTKAQTLQRSRNQKYEQLVRHIIRKQRCENIVVIETIEDGIGTGISRLNCVSSRCHVIRVKYKITEGTVDNEEGGTIILSYVQTRDTVVQLTATHIMCSHVYLTTCCHVVSLPYIKVCQMVKNE